MSNYRGPGAGVGLRILMLLRLPEASRSVDVAFRTGDTREVVDAARDVWVWRRAEHYDLAREALERVEASGSRENQLAATWALMPHRAGDVDTSMQADAPMEVRFARASAVASAPLTEESLHELVRRYHSGVSFDRHAAAEAMGEVRLSGPVVDDLVEGLSAPDVQDRHRAAVALTASAAHPVAADALATLVLGPGDGQDVLSAALSLSGHRDLPTAVIDHLVEAMRTSNSSRTRGLAALAATNSLHQPGVKRAWLSTVHAAPDGELDALAKVADVLKDEDVLATVLSVLVDPRHGVEVRSWLLLAVAPLAGRLDVATALADVAERSEVRDWSFRVLLGDALSAVPYPEVLARALVGMLRKGVEPVERPEILRALRPAASSDDAFEALVPHLRSEAVAVREAAADALELVSPVRLRSLARPYREALLRYGRPGSWVARASADGPVPLTFTEAAMLVGP